MNGTEKAIDRITRFGPFMHVGLAQDDGAGVFQAGHYRGVKIGYPIGKDLRSSRSSDSFGCEVVLDGNRDTM